MLGDFIKKNGNWAGIDAGPTIALRDGLTISATENLRRIDLARGSVYAANEVRDPSQPSVLSDAGGDGLSPVTINGNRSTLYMNGEGTPLVEQVLPDWSTANIYADGYSRTDAQGGPTTFTSRDMSGLGSSLSNADYQFVSDRAAQLQWGTDNSPTYHAVAGFFDDLLGLQPNPMRTVQQQTGLTALQGIVNDGPEPGSTWSGMGSDGVPRVSFGVFGTSESTRSDGGLGFIDEVRSAAAGPINQGSAIGTPLPSSPYRWVTNEIIDGDLEGNLRYVLRSAAPVRAGHAPDIHEMRAGGRPQARGHEAPF